MAQVNKKIDEMTVPDGGIGNFIMDDAEIEAAYGDDDDGMEEYGDEGIAQFPALTKKMAAMGREGDDMIAHLQTGELVIPLALIEQDDALKESIFQRLRDMGVEEPERYVVGSDANSINPATGAPEFFLKKLVRSVVKGVKKVVKAVVKVVKKVAPIILPIALSFTPLGPIYGAALGSGIGTLIQGGSIKDALKSALVAGAMGAVSSGFTGGGSFMENIQTSLADPIGRFGQTLSGAQTSLSNIYTDSSYVRRAANTEPQTFFSDYIAPAGQGTPTVSTQGQAELAGDASTVRTEAVSAASPQQTSAVETLRASDTSIARLNNTGAPVEVTLANGAGQAIPTGGQIPAGATVNPTLPTLSKPPTFTESIKDAFTPGGRSFTESMGDAFFPNASLSGGSLPAGEVITNPSATEYLQASGINPLAATTAQQTAASNIVSSAAPGFLRTYGPMAAVGTGVAAASGFFTPPEQEQLDIAMRDENGNVITGEDLVAADPSKYLVSDLGSQVLDPNTGQYVPRASTSVGPVGDLTIQAPTYSSYQAPTQYALGGGQPYLASSTPGGPFARPYVTQAAEGGAIFPRRNGGIMPDEGIPGQDSVRAMLMPGEFVMTTDAVRGMGNGNLNNGIKNMYSVMRNLESRGRAMA
jgi:hypothetical protein